MIEPEKSGFPFYPAIDKHADKFLVVNRKFGPSPGDNEDFLEITSLKPEKKPPQSCRLEFYGYEAPIAEIGIKRPGIFKIMR